MRKYAALVWPLVGAVVMTALLGYREAATVDGVSASEWVILATQGLMVIAAWGAVNVPGWQRGKAFQSGVMAVMALLAALITGGLTGDEIMQLLIAFGSAAGVLASGGPVIRTARSSVAPPPLR